jgi:ParB/RepB/Spo0J family partition protein
VKTKGIIQPILVRPANVVATYLDGEKYELVCGARRYRASKMAGKKNIPAIIRNLSDVNVLEIQTIENDQREDVNPMEQAIGYRRLLECDGYDVAKIAAKTGRSESYVQQRLQLTKLLPEFQEMVLDERLPFSHARLIARIGQDSQKELLSGYEFQGRANEDWEAPDMRSLQDTLNALNRDLSSAAFRKDDASLVPEAGVCTTCPHRTGFNRSLFPDFDPKQDTCLNPVCFQKKQCAFVERKANELEAQGITYKPIYDGNIPWEQQKEAKRLGIVEVWHVHELTPKEVKRMPASDVAIALFVGGKRAGQVIKITDPKNVQGSSDGEARRRSEDRKARAANAAARQIREQLFTKIHADPDHENAIAFLARVFWGRAYNESQKRIAQQLGWQKDKVQYSTRFDKACAKFIASGKQAAQELMIRIAVECTSVPTYGGNLPEELVSDAKAFGVDAKAILKQCQSDLSQKAKKAKASR